MKLRNRYLFPFITLIFACTATSAFAQSELVVEWADADGEVVVNALHDAIANDSIRPGDRVYVLRRGGRYWNQDRIDVDGFHLRIHGETRSEADPAQALVCGPSAIEDCGHAIVQRVHKDDGSITDKMIQTTGSRSHMTIDHIWIMGQTDQGVRSGYQPIQMNANDSRYAFDNVVFDRNDSQHLGISGTNTDLFVTNSKFRNIFGPTQQLEGMGMQFDAGADTVVVENSTFLNIGFTLMMNEAAPINYLRVNNNTFVNIGRTFTSGAIWKEAYVVNNVFINYFWHGEQPSEYEDPNALGDYRGFFDIRSMPPQFGANLDRRIVLANNTFWRDEQFAAMMPDNIRAQPVISDTTAAWFAAFDGMVMQDNYLERTPVLYSYPADIIPAMVANIADLRGGSSAATRYDYDPGRDEACPTCNIWPVPEQFSYDDEDLFTGGVGGMIPVGDLNWFPPGVVEFYYEIQAFYVALVEDLAGERGDLLLEATIEAETGVLENATVAPVEGFTYYEMQTTGFVEWDFEMAAAGAYDLAISTRMAHGTRGNHVSIDGKRFKNQAFPGNGEFVFDVDVLGRDWVEYRITPDSI